MKKLWQTLVEVPRLKKWKIRELVLCFPVPEIQFSKIESSKLPAVLLFYKRHTCTGSASFWFNRFHVHKNKILFSAIIQFPKARTNCSSFFFWEMNRASKICLIIIYSNTASIFSFTLIWSLEILKLKKKGCNIKCNFQDDYILNVFLSKYQV